MSILNETALVNCCIVNYIIDIDKAFSNLQYGATYFSSSLHRYCLKIIAKDLPSLSSFLFEAVWPGCFRKVSS